MLEKQIEKKICDFAKQLGYLAYKFSSPAHASVPDRLLFNRHGFCLLMEIKRLDGKLSPGQEREINRLRSNNVRVEVVYSVEEGIDILIKYSDMKC